MFKKNQTQLHANLGSAELDLDLDAVEVLLDPTKGDLIGSLLGTADQAGEAVKALVGHVADPASMNPLKLGVCLDTTYDSPTGVNLSMWRFVGVGVGDAACGYSTAAGEAPPIVLGYATVSPDRVRQLYSAAGKLVSVIDPAGNELRYQYGVVGNILGLNGPLQILQTPLSQLRRVYDPKTCPALVPVELPTINLRPRPECRELSFLYHTRLKLGGTLLEQVTQVTDPAGRTISYATDILTSTLSSVETKTGCPTLLDQLLPCPPTDGEVLERWAYTYQGVDNVTCSGTPGQMCSVTAPNGARTTFTYGAGGKITELRERAKTEQLPGDPVPADNLAALTTQFSYTGTQTDVTQESRVRRYAGIDTALRVAEISAGSAQQLADDKQLSRVIQVWDGSGPGGGAPLCQPAADSTGSRLNHNLCQTRIKAGVLVTANAPIGYEAPTDQVVDYEYTPEGYVLTESRSLGGENRLVTSNRYLVSVYKQDHSVPVPFDDGFGATTEHRPTNTMFVVVDHTATRSPGGKRTFLDVDANPAVPMGTLGDPIGAPADGVRACGLKPRTQGTHTAGGNTGLVCHVRTLADPNATPGSGDPHADPEAPRDPQLPDPYKVEVVTRAYDRFGQARTEQDATGATTRYEYYGDTERDLTSYTLAGGWLKATIDPTGAFVFLAYDRAGNVVRTWDRNATEGLSIAAFNPSGQNIESPMSARYTEVQMGEEPTPLGAFSEPWRYPYKSRTAKGEVTELLEVDKHGNAWQTRTPLGHTTKRTFDARDQLVTEELPENTGKPTTFTYDGAGRPTAVVTPTTGSDTSVTTSAYDDAGRRTQVRFTRGDWTDQQTYGDTGCEQSTGDHAPIPPNHIMCTATWAYSGTGQPVVATDPAGIPSWTSFDATGRTTDSWVYRGLDEEDEDEDGDTQEKKWIRTSQKLDEDGRATTTCAPRQWIKEAAAGCGPGSHHATHTTYDGLDRPIKALTYREKVSADGTFQTTGSGQAWDEVTTVQTYDPTNRTVTTVDPNSAADPARARTTRMDELGRKIEMSTPRSTDGAVKVTTAWAYDPVGNTTSATVSMPDTTSVVTAWRYDENNQLVDTVEAATSPNAAADDIAYPADDSPPTNLRTRTYYDKDGRPAASLDSRAFTGTVTAPDLRYLVRSERDRNDRPVAQWTPLWDEQNAKPLDNGPERTECPMLTAEGERPTSLEGVPAMPDGVGVCVQRNTYHPSGQLATAKSPTRDVDQFQAFTWTDDGLLRAIEGPSPTGSGRVTTARRGYDGAGRVVRTRDAVGYLTLTTWNGDGLPVESTERETAGGAVQHQQKVKYNSDGQQMQTETVVSGSLTTIAKSQWYADGLPHQQISPLGNTNRWAFDGNGNPTKVWSPSAVVGFTNNTASLPVTHSYTADNLPQRTVEPVAINGSERRATTYTYDALGRKTEQKVDKVNGSGGLIESAGAQTFQWSANGYGLSEVGRKGERIDRTFDVVGKVTRTTDQSNGVTVEAQRLLNGAAVKVKTTTGIDVSSTGAAWHADGVQKLLIAGDAEDPATNNKYSQITEFNDSRLPTKTTITDPHRASEWSGASYDQAGRPLTRTDPDQGVTNWTWQPDGDLENLELKNGQNVIDRWTVEHDIVHRPTSIKRHKGTATEDRGWTYDDDGRVKKETGLPTGDVDVNWDPDGNRIQYGTQTPAYRADGSLGAGSYDVAGNLKSIDGCNNDFDGFDRRTAASGCGKPSVSYTYDGFDRQSTVTTVTTESLTKSIRYAGTTTAVLAEVPSQSTGDAAKTARYHLWSDGGALAVTDSAGKRQILHTDPQGSTVLATNGSATECSARLDAWGVHETPEGEAQANAPAGQTCKDGGATANNRWYNQDRTDQTGTYQHGSRTYDPTRAAWLSADGYRGGGAAQDLSISVDPLTQNRYAYVNGDPLNYWDRDGHGLSLKDFGHLVLDVAGLVPVIGEIADLANCGWYAVEGEWVDAGLSCASAIPFAGYVATVGKVAKHGDEVVTAAKAAEELADKARKADQARELAEQTQKAEKASQDAAAKALRDQAARKAAADQAAKQTDEAAKVRQGAEASAASKGASAGPAGAGRVDASKADPIAARLEMHKDFALRAGEDAHSKKMQRSLADSPSKSREAAFRGTQLDSAVKKRAFDDPWLQKRGLLESPRTLPKGQRRPDWLDPHAGRWYDLTTGDEKGRQWRDHVRKYGSRGTGIFYS